MPRIRLGSLRGRLVAKPVSSTAAAIIADGIPHREWVADLIYDEERRLANVPILSPRLSWSGSRFVAGDGSLTVVWSDDHARSMIPRQVGDWFSPFGAELQIDCIIRAGRFAERVPQGRFVITSVPDAESRSILFDGRPIVAGESFTVNVKDPLVRVQRDEFPFPTSPRSTSVWGEVQSITGMPVIRSVPDAAVPLSMTYADDKAAVLSQLFDALGAWPQVDSAGALTARPKEWPAPVGDVLGVVSAPVSMESDRTHNRVVVTGKSPDGDPVMGVSEVTEGFLRVRNPGGTASPFGVATYRHHSDMFTTTYQCEQYARELLPRVSRLRGVTRRIVERFNPIREVGDVLRFEGGVVRVLEVTHEGAETRVTVEVPDA